MVVTKDMQWAALKVGSLVALKVPSRVAYLVNKMAELKALQTVQLLDPEMVV